MLFMFWLCFFYRGNIQRLLKVRLRNIKCQHNDFNVIVFLISTVFGPKGIRNELTQVETWDVFWWVTSFSATAELYSCLVTLLVLQRQVVTHFSCLLQKKHQTKSLEELANIVEVLEEDLKTCQSNRLPNTSPSASYSSEFWVEDASPHSFMNTYGQENEIPLSPIYSVPSSTSPVHSVSSSYPSPTYSQGAGVFLGNQEDYSSYESDKYRYDGLYGMSCSPANSCEYQVPSTQESFNASPNPEVWEVSSQEMNYPPWPHSQQEQCSGMTFWTQLEKEENLLKEISDQELLAVDENGRT